MSLDVFASAPEDLVDSLLRQARLAQFKPGATVWASASAPATATTSVSGGVEDGRAGAGAGADSGAGCEGGEGGGLYVVVSGVVCQTYTTADGAVALRQLQGAGWLVGELGGLCGGSAMPGREEVVACGNSFGRGPLLYHFPRSAVEALLKR